MSDDPHPANRCHQCGRRMDNFKPSPGSPGVGQCPEHGVSYGAEYVGPGSIFNDQGQLADDVEDEEIIERVQGGGA